MSWIASYEAARSADNTSPLFKRAAAIFAVAAAVQRKCWMRSRSETVFPNLYMLLVGPSAAGKGVALGPMADALAGLNRAGEGPLIHIAPASVTSAALADELEDAAIHFMAKDMTPYQYNALTIISREFGVFLPAYDSQMLNTLTDLYDNKGYDERRRGKGKRLTIKDATLNMIGGTTPAYLNNTLPEGAWEEGFMSRTIVVYAGALPPVEIIEEVDGIVATEASVRAELRDISQMHGQIKWHPDALRHFNAWLLNGRQPQPTHPKLIYYNERRHWNAMKIAMISAIARRSRKVEELDVDFALDFLFTCEAQMPEVFKAMKTGGDQEAIRELWYFMYQRYIKPANNNRPIARHALVQFLQAKVPAYRIEQIIQIMEAAHFIKYDGKGGYTPVKESDT